MQMDIYGKRRLSPVFKSCIYYGIMITNIIMYHLLSYISTILQQFVSGGAVVQHSMGCLAPNTHSLSCSAM